MSKSKRESGAELRERLLESATQQVRAHGVSNFSLRKTAQDIGVDPAMVYRHFDSKDDLIEQVALAAFARLAEGAADAVSRAKDDPVARLLALGRSYIEFAVANPAEFELMFAGGRRAAIPSEVPSAYDQLEALLTELDDAGRLRIAVHEAALMCWASVHGLANLLLERALDGYQLSEPDEVVETVLGNLLSFLSAPT